jgi:MFS family permease
MADRSKPPTPKRKRPHYFYGWNIVGASFLAHLAYAEQFSSTLGLFFRPLNQEFGWSRLQIAIVQTIARSVEALAAPLVGPLIDRYGARSLMPIGAIIATVSLLAVTQIDSLWQFYLVRGVVAAVGFTLMGFLVTGVAINNWFIRMRGRALAISNVGSSISNVILMPSAVFVIAAFGWRSMFGIFAIITILVVLIPSAILMRRRPEDMGLLPDGAEPAEGDQGTDRDAAPTSAIVEEIHWTRREAIREPTFWFLSLSFAVASLAFQGINISLAPYAQDLGYSDAIVAATLTVRALVMAVTLPLVGLLAEHADRPGVRIFPFACQGVGAVLFLFGSEPVFLWAAVMIYGVGITSLGVTQEVLWANSFGRVSLGTVRSTGFVITFGFGAAGPILMNLIFEVLGSYRPAFVLFVVLFTIAAVMAVFIRPPRHRTTIEPAGS